MSNDGGPGVAGNPEISVITGGLGYIGQSLAFYLTSQGDRVVVVDRSDVLPQVKGIPVVRGMVGDPDTWNAVARMGRVKVIYHCAGLISVAESVIAPQEYFQHNVVQGVGMLDHILSVFGPVPVVFSSSAAVYGVPRHIPVPETAPVRPLSPYGITKRQFEEVLAAYQAAYGLPWMALRYFNAAGMIGPVRENHRPETHLLPKVADAIREGKAPVIYGTDYPTPDGTAVRDYVHVRDLVRAHRLAAEALYSGLPSEVVNLGSGQGTSVAEVVQAFRDVAGRAIPVREEARRPGDPPILVADVRRANEILDWRPEHSDIGRIVAEVWAGRADPY